MNNLLIAINAKYSHTSLAVRYLKACSKDEVWSPKVLEYTINQHEDDIIRNIMTYDPDLVTFSCYIWNYEMILRICKDLRMINPSIKILLGGPEVSYDSLEILKAHDQIDVIMIGEGEDSYCELCEYIYKKKDLSQVKGIVYKDQGFLKTPDRPLIGSLDLIPFPYESLEGLEHKKLYYESSRGCPYNCQYCLSSTTGRVRFFSLERVKEDMMFFLKQDVLQVKFVDRTFNANPKRALEIMKFIKKNDNQKTNFHFEIVASLLDDETMVFLETVRPGLFQFEIGVQTTYDKTMAAIERNISFEVLSEKVRALSSNKNVHIHLDLIAGLPFETYDIFLSSFEAVYRLKPEMLQLGFLKLLKGSGLRINKELYGYVFSNYAPYEIYYNKYISYKALNTLKDLEAVVELFYNNGRFNNALEMMIEKHYQRAVDFYLDLANYYRKNGYFDQPHKVSYLYEILMDFYRDSCSKEVQVFKEVLKYDYYLNFSKEIALWGDLKDKTFKNTCYDLLKEKTIFFEEDLSPKEWLKRLTFVMFDMDVIKFLESHFEELYKNNTILVFDHKKKDGISNTALSYNVTRHFTQES
jgi:radical SAM superfamily enzyme YgiQ (UPF0313 family)